MALHKGNTILAMSLDQGIRRRVGKRDEDRDGKRVQLGYFLTRVCVVCVCARARGRDFTLS